MHGHRLIGTFALCALLALPGCSRKQGSAEPNPAPAATVPSQSVQQPLLMSANDAASLRQYLESVQETPARRFDVEWNPDVVRLDRATAIRALRGISADGRVYEFASDDPAVQALQPGRIMSLWGIAVRRVRSVQTGTVTRIETDPVSLSEMFTRADIELDYALRPSAPIVVPHVQAPDAPPAPSSAANRAADQPRFILARYSSEDEPPGSTPAEAGAPSADEGTHIIPLGMSTWGAKDVRGFDLSAKYGPSGDGIAFEFQARLAQSDLGDNAGPDQSADPKAGGAVQKSVSQAQDERRKKDVADIRRLRGESAPNTAGKDWEKTKKEGPTGPLDKKMGDLRDLVTHGSLLWDMRIGLKGNLHAASTDDTLHVTSNIVVKDSALALMRTDFNNVRGDLHVFFVARRGEQSEQWIQKFKVELPIRFNIPVIVGGLPFMFQVAFNFIAQPALATKNDSFTAQYDIPFQGNGTLSLTGGKLTTGGTLQSVPQVLKSVGSSIGVSAVLIAVQAPRVGFGLGLFSSSSVGYIDLVNTFTITSAGTLGMFPCQHHQLVSTINAGVDTQIAYPLEGWAKLLNTPVSDTLKKISDAASARKTVFKKDWVRISPEIKACELGSK